MLNSNQLWILVFANRTTKKNKFAAQGWVTSVGQFGMEWPIYSVYDKIKYYHLLQTVYTCLNMNHI